MSVTYRQLTKLLTPFPQKMIEGKPGSSGASFVAHHVVEQRIIDALGCPPDFALVQVIRGFVAAKPPDPSGNSAKAKAGSPALEDAVCGVVARMRCTIDGYRVVVEEAGDCEAPHNWPHDGARMKDAMSDAYKRCAMRIGVALHLWAQEHFYIGQKLREQDEAADAMRLPPAVEDEDAF